ncbi:hypothetical protein Tco_1414739, partial [Tanacetum coccineum]
TEDLDAYDSDCDDVSNAKAVLMANLSNYGSDVISEVPHFEPYHTDMDNQSVHAMQGFEQTSVANFIDNEITSDSNIIPFSQYLQETQQTAVQDINRYAQQDSMILSVIEQMSEQMINHKAQQIKLTLYDGSVISKQHGASPVFDNEETLILEEVSRSKMLAKQNDPISKEKKVNTTLINYAELNRLLEDFGKRFVPQQEFSDEQAFWLQTSHPNTDQSASLPVKIEAPRELPKITPDAITEWEWGFEHTKAVFLKEIIPFLKTLKYIFNVFDKDLLNEDVLYSVMNSTTLNGESVNLSMQRSESCDKCFDLDAKLLKSQNAYNDLSKSYSQLKKHCISLELTMQLNQEFFLKDSFSDNQNALEIPEYFKNNDLKAQLQAKNTIICKLKEHIKSMRENDKEEKVKHEMDEIKTINIELEHSVAKLLYENERLNKEIEHLKKIYKDQFDSIKKIHALSKEHCDSLIAQLNSKSMENADLKGQI